MATPPDPQDELLPRAGSGSQWFGDRGEGENEAVTPTGAKPAPQAGEPGRGLGAGAGEAAPRELDSGPARPPPVAMETASTGKAGGERRCPANGVGDRVPQPVPFSASRLCTSLALSTLSTNLSPLRHGRL